MNDSLLIILNRSAESPGAGSEWIHVVPKGELPNRAAGVVQVLDDAALDSILANIAADRTRQGDKWPGIYAGREHFIYNDEQDSAALAWFKDFEKRADGIWARADGLTPVGKQVIANAEYKFTSFVADRKDTQKLEGNKIRILKLDTIGFTNQANGKELLTPITNRFSADARASAASNQKPNERTNTMKSIASKLGLAAEASEDAILAEVTKLQNRLTELTPLADENTTLKNRIAQFDGEQVDSLLELHGVKEDKVKNRLKPVLTAMKNREERVTALLDFGFKPAEAGKGGTQTRILNRADGNPKPGEATEQPANDQERAEKIRNRCDELIAGGMKFEAAFQKASREIPATA